MNQIVIPLYNEAANVETLLATVGPRLSRLGARLVLVDDGSTDRTVEMVERHVSELPARLVRHPANRGLGAAMRTGIGEALKDAEDDDAIVMIEADNTSDLADLDQLMARFEQGFDVV